MQNDPSWKRTCESVSAPLQSLERKTATIKRSTNKIFTVRDIAREREKVTNTTSAANRDDIQRLQEKLKLIEQYMQLNPEVQMVGVKIMAECQGALDAYRKACEGFYQKCMTVEETSRGLQPTDVGLRESDEENEEQGLLTQERVTQRASFERELYDEILQERTKESQEIAESVRDINEIFEQVNELVNHQGVKLETVRVNIDTSHRNTENGVRHLNRASDYQQDSSQNSCLLLVLVLVLLSITLLVLI